MKRLIVDLSSVIWHYLLAGEDKEFGRWFEVHDDKSYTQISRSKAAELPYKQKALVNSAAYGYELCVNHLVEVMDMLSVTPHQVLIVPEGRNSKADRLAIHAGYKQGRDKFPLQYEEFNKLKEQLLDAFCGLGAQAVWQDGGVEADDVIGYLAENLQGEIIIDSFDKDMAACVRPGVRHLRDKILDANPFGDFPHEMIPVRIALVGDSGDKIPGAKGFGETGWTNMCGVFGDLGLQNMMLLIKTRRLGELREDVAELKADSNPEMKKLGGAIQKIIDDAAGVYMSYELGRLRTEKVNTIRRPLQWRVGMVKQKAQIADERLRRYGGTIRIVSAENYAEALAWATKQFAITPCVALDVETSTPEESDEWLAAGDREDKVDVLGSELTSLQLTFGSNMQHTLYLAIDNVEVEGCTNLGIDLVAKFVGAIPEQKRTWVHNAQFELPVCFNAWGASWANDPVWHGFLRNVRDSKIAAHYADENRKLNLKALSKEVLGYEQVNYAQVTQRTMPAAEWDGEGRMIEQWIEPIGTGTFKEEMQVVDGVEVPVQGEEIMDLENGPAMVKVELKMNQLKASEVLSYGADDTICTAALANHFRTVMEIENTWDVFEEVETLPAYVQAKAFVDGIPFSLESMRKMSDDDSEAYDKAWEVLRAYLIGIKFEGTVCPEFVQLDKVAVFESFEVLTGEAFPNKRLGKLDKMAKLISQWADEDGRDEEIAGRARLLATAINANDIDTINGLVKQYFKGEPEINLDSPKQMKALLYDRLGLPVNWITDATDNERAEKPALFDAVMRFKRKLNGSNEVTITNEDLELLKAKAKTDAVAIEYALTFDGELISDEARAALKALGTMKKVATRRKLFYSKYWHALHWKTGRIHPNIQQCGTVTGRPTGSDPNPYQWPKKGEGVKFRENVVPHKRKAVVVSIDFSGQELRLAAERSQDKNMLACYVGDNLKDPHSITAAGAMEKKWGKERVREIFVHYAEEFGPRPEGWSQEEWEYHCFLRLRALGKSDPMGKTADDLRKDAKNVNFTAQFGGQAPKIAQRIIMRISDAQLFLDARAAQFPGLIEAAERAEEFAAKHGYALTMLGKRRHLREAMMSEDRRESSRAERQAWNMEIQGSAAEMMKLAMKRMWERGVLHKYDFVFYASIYDEIAFSVHKDHALAAIREVNECMTAPYATMTVPILASISLGPDFGHQIECGDWVIEENIQNALNDVFERKEAA